MRQRALLIVVTVLLINCAHVFPRRTAEVDLIDLNHVVNQAGQINLVQVVLWNLEDHGHGWDYYVVDWRFAKDCGPLERIHGHWRIRFAGRWVTARVNGIETWSNTDVEVDDRRRLAPTLRTKLK